jgi:hypothetical protein
MYNFSIVFCRGHFVLRELDFKKGGKVTLGAVPCKAYSVSTITALFHCLTNHTQGEKVCQKYYAGNRLFKVMGETSLSRMMGRKIGQYSSIHKNLPEVRKNFFL